MIGFEPQDLLVQFDCLLRPACSGQYAAQIIEGRGVVVLKSQGLLGNVR